MVGMRTRSAPVANFLATVWDILPIMAILVGAQVLLIRRRIANLRRVLVGFLFILIGLTGGETSVDWREFGWIYLFAFTVGFATTIAEPSLIAVAMKANEVSGSAIHPWGLRIAVALGVAVSIALGAFRKHPSRHILETIAEAGGFRDRPGSGIAFQVDVEDAIGIDHQVRKLTELVEEEI